ncbi:MULTISPECIES: polyphosphate kinase 2 family protein [unclassified Coleofasciculus]|uniref:polyphosphate kinase 2 family protein n=1 Tax=Cyanophyceae TaxID=3028117 RepID=UPI001683E768|nr:MULTISPECIES: polyphosphate kinase 2 family protein [unclassified Coleofasciculus]MBD1840794.1 polyphosphate kinase 2 family protein [Coleofasciculus sp. FACHB-501]MBD1880868.1 polyphosphate kinase 2 family protein [Coleofasciculus sp. FACHB-T130]MBD1897085.1 polyphosphate kinase 2 family protein [Coleofasciculus sp. FACHB-129]MBD2085667.1 polyphosphate kinase 2 family protein [Coleofasciculus sp. FACHB-542]
MSQSSNLPNNSSTTTDASTGEEHKTQQAAAKATAKVAFEMAPEKIVVDSPPPKPNYPHYRVHPGEQFVLASVDPNASEDYKNKKDIEQELQHQRQRLQNLQERLYAEHQRSLLIVLQAMDTGGKDGTIKHVFGGVNPQGCQVWSFKKPSEEEAGHDFLWRYHQRTPLRGMITIFNRSHYEDVLIVRVKQLVPENVWRERYHIINEFEHMLTLNNIAVIKFFLHISKDEQKRRLQSRLEDPDKHWKFSSNDLKERLFWDEYQKAFEDAIINCSTEYAPWYVVPANNKWYRNLVIARTIADTLEAMNPQYPKPEMGLESILISD